MEGLLFFCSMDSYHPHNNLDFLSHRFILNDLWVLFIHFPSSLTSIRQQANVNRSGYLTKTRVPPVLQEKHPLNPKVNQV